MHLLHLDKNHEYLISKLDEIGFKNDIDLISSKTEIEKKIHKYSGLILRSRIPIDDTFIKKATNLKFIARVGSGLENIDVQSAKANNIEVISAGEANANAVGEHIFGLLFSLINKINISSIQVKKGIWKREQNRGIEIEGKTVGIIGFGKTGKSFAKKLTGFDCTVLYHDIQSIPSEFNATLVDIKTLKEKSDIISIHTDYNKSSHNIINTEFINSCSKNFILINTARGLCVNSKDLVSGIKSGKVIGACLDVLDFEESSFENVSSDDSFEFLKNSDSVILTPHVAGWTAESKLKLSSVILEKIISLNLI
jgi:D-3-phosphoglycerate dehydrogenase